MAFHSGKPRKGAHLIKTDKKKAEKTAAAPPRKRRIPAALIVILVLLVLLAGGALGAVYFYPNIFPGVTVGSIDVGGLSRDEAAQQIAIKSKPLYQGKKLTLTIYDADYDIPVENVLSGVDDIQSAENAWKVGREGGPLARMTAIISAMRDGCDTRLDASVDEAGLKAQLEEIAAEALTEPVAPAWKLDGENLVIQSGTPGVQFDTSAVEQALTAQIELMDFKPYEVSTDVTAAPAIDIDKIAEDVTGSPVNATVSKEDGKTIIPGKSGVQFDVEKAKEIIGDGSQASYSIPVTITQPTITEAVLRERLFRDTLARTATNLNEGNAPRTNNVRLAAKAINGTILNPGDVFSYNTVLANAHRRAAIRRRTLTRAARSSTNSAAAYASPPRRFIWPCCARIWRSSSVTITRSPFPTRRSARMRPWTTAISISVSRTILPIPSRSWQNRPTDR